MGRSIMAWTGILIVIGAGACAIAQQQPLESSPAADRGILFLGGAEDGFFALRLPPLGFGLVDRRDVERILNDRPAGLLSMSREIIGSLERRLRVTKRSLARCSS